MKKNHIAVILYTLREFIQEEDDLVRTLEKVRSIGYECVQISGIREGGPSAAFIRKACDEAGLVIAATHEPAASLLAEPHAVLERLELLNTEYTAYPFPQNVDLASENTVREWLANLERAAQVLREGGKTLTYHNHAQEFYRLNGKLLYERIFEETTLDAELDTYWVQAGGGSPLEWTKHLANQRRLPLMHLKDLRVELPNKPQFAEIGSGNINFKSIIAAADRGGCKYYIVEQDNCWGLSPFECIKSSFDYLTSNLVCE